MKKPAPRKLAVLNRYVFLLLIAVIVSVKTHAQDFFPQQTDYGIRIGTDVELPGKNMESYKSTLGYSIGFMRLLDHITLGAHFSYREFRPKTLMTTTQIDAGNEATLTYSNYTAFLFYLSGVYNVPITERLTGYGGINIGMGYNTSYTHYTDDNNNIYLGGACKQAYLAPKLGVGFAVHNNVEIDAYTGYNLFIQSGNLNNNPPSGYTGVAATSYSAIVTGMGLVFKF
ncbi:hypothetical protein ACFQZN_02870 [Mucilaginibacter boryungensis]|uniref:Outer membrane protein beta-barrel domain-containing protein n=1 Tax=Mucilaginibacter boryungensis TaxID=768480 RepID=A0ABR9XKA6_9SPHI|nr:hypothetical protein [Mucilaginibacter boryungensis]MBE9667814.1 hypothetical protein [Mucilaginibacter boryungensis]